MGLLMFGIVLLIVARVFVSFWRHFRKTDAGASPEALIVAFAALSLAVMGIALIVDSFMINIREQEAKIAIEHKGHEVLHARIKSELITAEPGDILEIPNGERMFIMVRRYSGSIETRNIYASAESRQFYVGQLVLDHARVIKFGTPEHSATLVAEAEKRFSNLRKLKFK